MFDRTSMFRVRSNFALEGREAAPGATKLPENSLRGLETPGDTTLSSIGLRCSDRRSDIEYRTPIDGPSDGISGWGEGDARPFPRGAPRAARAAGARSKSRASPARWQSGGIY